MFCFVCVFVYCVVYLESYLIDPRDAALPTSVSCITLFSLRLFLTLVSPALILQL